LSGWDRDIDQEGHTAADRACNILEDIAESLEKIVKILERMNRLLEKRTPIKHHRMPDGKLVPPRP